MFPLEWLRVFVCVYRAGSVSAAARERSISQSAVSQQLASLERAVGVPLFERTSRGVAPTPRGRALYAESFEALDRLERVARSLSPRHEPNPVVRIGASPELFHEFFLPRVASHGIPLVASLGDDRELLGEVETGAIDVALTVTKPSSRSVQFRALGLRRYAMIAPLAMSSPVDLSPRELALWLNDRDWVSYSEERPVTRRYWQQTLGVRFDAKVRLVAPDLRAVVRAVELGIGASIVPEFACRRSLDEGRVRELWPIGEAIPPDRMFLSYRVLDADRQVVGQIASALAMGR
jgi:DNA-binding transcriptional LysR family regulator